MINFSRDGKAGIALYGAFFHVELPNIESDDR
jgi:hypothetical protein